MSARRSIGVLLLASVCLAPSAVAWGLTPAYSSPPDHEGPLSAWLLAAQPSLGGAREAAACALGDVDGDGVDDLVVRVKESATGPARLRALAGPDLNRTLWVVGTGDRVLQCAPDLDLDGTADPVTAIASGAGAAAQGGAPVANEAVDRAMQVVDGASGQALISRQHEETRTGAAPQSDAGGLSATSLATADLLPAAAGAEAFLETQTRQTQLVGLPTGLLPVSTLTATAQSTAVLQLLDARGAVQGTITIDQPGVEPLALAPIPTGAGLPNVAALTAQAVAPVHEASSQVPTLSMYNPDGSLAWATQLAASQGVPILIPRAGDVDLDGVQDLIVSTVEAGVQAAPGSQFEVLSGLNGETLLSSGPPVDGIKAALPLGQLADGTAALLDVQQMEGATELTLSAVTTGGTAVWTITTAADSLPVNLRPDAYTGDALGFTDLTGDAVPDVATALATPQGLALQAFNGVSGATAWTATLTDAARVVPLPSLATLQDIGSTASGLPSDLVALQNATKGPGLSLIQGASGQAIWTVQGAMPQGAASVDVAVEAAGDLNADGVQEVLATVTPLDAQGVAAPADVYALSGADGSTLWSMSTDPGEPVGELAATAGPAQAARALELEPSESGGGTPGLAAPLLLVVLVAAAAVHPLRRR